MVFFPVENNRSDGYSEYLNDFFYRKTTHQQRVLNIHISADKLSPIIVRIGGHNCPITFFTRSALLPSSQVPGDTTAAVDHVRRRSSKQSFAELRADNCVFSAYAHFLPYRRHIGQRFVARRKIVARASLAIAVAKAFAFRARVSWCHRCRRCTGLRAHVYRGAV